MDHTARLSKEKFIRIWRFFKIGMYVCIPFLLLALPADYFDHGTPGFSLFSRLGMQGHFSEGLTRATMHLIHFDFQKAADYNKLSFVILPLLVSIWIASFIRDIVKLKKSYSK